MTAHEIGTVKIWGGNTYRVTIWFDDGEFYAILGHRKFPVQFGADTGMWHERAQAGLEPQAGN